MNSLPHPAFICTILSAGWDHCVVFLVKIPVVTCIIMLSFYTQGKQGHIPFNPKVLSHQTLLQSLQSFCGRLQSLALSGKWDRKSCGKNDGAWAIALCAELWIKRF